MNYFAAIAIAVALIAVAIFGCALGQGRVVSSAVEGIYRITDDLFTDVIFHFAWQTPANKRCA